MWWAEDITTRPISDRLLGATSRMTKGRKPRMLILLIVLLAAGWSEPTATEGRASHVRLGWLPPSSA